MLGTPQVLRIPLVACRWVRNHAVHIFRLAVVLAVAALTALAGHTCHGLIGPPG